MLIVDPPRKGLDDGVLRLLLGKHETAEAPGAYVLQHDHHLLLPLIFFVIITDLVSVFLFLFLYFFLELKRLIYISCGFDALERDTR